MEQTSQVSIHIGLHKTGTSYLQDILFPSLPHVSVIRGWQSHRAIFATPLESQLIITDESISGRLFEGQYGQDFRENVQKIKNLYHEPKIIFGIRSQHKFLLSCYKQYLHQGGTEEISYLYNIENTGLIKHEELFLLPKIQLLKDTFKDVFIYSQESLRNRPEDFIAGLCEFLGLKNELSKEQLSKKSANVGIKTVEQMHLLRNINRFNSRLMATKIFPSMYGKWFQKLRITPNHIVKRFFKSWGSNNIELEDLLNNYLMSYYKEDWTASVHYISY